MDHCSACGAEQWGYNHEREGYTECCNKRQCSGGGAGNGSLFQLVTNLETFVDAGTVRACCVAKASEAARAQGAVVSHLVPAR